MLLVCQQIKGATAEELEKLKASGSFASITELTPEALDSAKAGHDELLAVARRAEEREKRNAKISAAIAIGSFGVAVASFLFNYYRSAR